MHPGLAFKSPVCSGDAGIGRTFSSLRAEVNEIFSPNTRVFSSVC